MPRSITPAPRAGQVARPLGPGRMPLFRGLRPLKRWRYVGFFSDELSGCAALVQIGPARQSFWALKLAGEQALRERTRMLPRSREMSLSGSQGTQFPGECRLLIRDRGVVLELEIEEGEAIEALCPHGRHSVWTRKQAGVCARGTLALDGGPPSPVRALAVIDDTAGHHARETEWRWSAGIGEGLGGEQLAWNLVSGVNDPPSGSERAVWVNGVPREVPPVAFAADLSSIRCSDGSELRFAAQAERNRHEKLLILSSDYRAPFGSFEGTLPGGVTLARGRGVMEHHRARW